MIRWLLALTLWLPHWLSALEVPPGKTSQPSPFPALAQQEFTYRPVDRSFWEEVIAAEKENDHQKMVNLALSQRKKFGENSLEADEAQLALGLGFKHQGLIFAAMKVFQRLATGHIGEHLGQAGLYHLSLLIQEHEVDEELIERFIMAHEFLSDHDEIKSFISYYQAVNHLKHGFKKFWEQQKKNIAPGSYWDLRLQYILALADVARGKLTEAKFSLQKISQTQTLPQRLRDSVSLQLARLQFEEGEFASAFDIYTNLSHLSLRDRGQVQMERAWSQYYLREYGKAMGLLAALKSPLFDPSVHLERYILELVIYKELCHYQAVEELAKEFHKDFAPTLKYIRSRKPLREEKRLMSLAVQDRTYQASANMIGHLRQEVVEFNKKISGNDSLLSELKKSYEQVSRELQKQLDLKLEERARAAAEELLDTEEQVSFIEYTAKLDALRIRQGSAPSYSPPVISNLRFDNVYWPVGREHWTDELESYQMLISSQCEKTSADSSSSAKGF